MNALHPDSAAIVVAVGDEALRAEAIHAAAATSHDVLTVTDPRDVPRSLPGAFAVLVDSLMARVVAAAQRPHTAPVPVLFLAADPGPIDYEAALACHAESAFIIPAQVKELLAGIAAAGTPQDTRPGSATIAVVGASGGVGGFYLRGLGPHPVRCGWARPAYPVSYTHLTLPTNREE